MVKQDVLPEIVVEIMELKHAKPFRPFEIRTSDGSTFVIEKSERVGRSPSGRVVSFYAKNVEGHRMVDATNITSVKPTRRRRVPPVRGRGKNKRSK
jgi:hypothetical protein